MLFPKVPLSRLITGAYFPESTGFVTLMHHNRAISRDPQLFDDADSFKPGRWFKPGTTEFRNDIVFPGFGFGRRVCPGEELAFRCVARRT
jgi:ferulate-5-hydroxylase